jgi:hypothetical protein
MAAQQLHDGNAEGVQIGQAATDKIGHYGATPVVQAAHIADATDATTALTRINAVLVVLENLGFTATS